MDLSRYKLTSRRRGGQWSGPCWFTGQGVDRFTIEPHNSRGPVWFCRECGSGCQHGFRGNNNTRYGTFTPEELGNLPDIPPIKRTQSSITYDMAIKMAESMDEIGLSYLHERGLDATTIAKFHLGMQAGKFITIPLVYEWEGRVRCPAIKKRWIPQFRPADQPKYLAVSGSHTKGVFNFDALRKPGEFGVIGNSLFDVMLLDQLGFTVAGPFAGEADWEVKWSEYIQWPLVINLGDWDTERPGANGELYRPGTHYMLSRAFKLSSAHNVKKIVNVYPPEGYDDISAAHQAGIDIHKWISNLVQEA